MKELRDLAEEWDLTLGTVSDETGEVYRTVGQFATWRACLARAMLGGTLAA